MRLLGPIYTRACVALTGLNVLSINRLLGRRRRQNLWIKTLVRLPLEAAANRTGWPPLSSTRPAIDSSLCLIHPPADQSLRSWQVMSARAACSRSVFRFFRSLSTWSASRCVAQCFDFISVDIDRPTVVFCEIPVIFLWEVLQTRPWLVKTW